MVCLSVQLLTRQSSGIFFIHGLIFIFSVDLVTHRRSVSYSLSHHMFLLVSRYSTFVKYNPPQTPENYSHMCLHLCLLFGQTQNTFAFHPIWPLHVSHRVYDQYFKCEQWYKIFWYLLLRCWELCSLTGCGSLVRLFFFFFLIMDFGLMSSYVGLGTI